MWWKRYQASSRWTSQKRLLKLSMSAVESGLREELVENPKTPTRALEFLSARGDDLILKDIVQHPNCSERLQEEIFESHRCSLAVSLSLARNPKTPVKILLKIMNGEAQNVLPGENRTILSANNQLMCGYLQQELIRRVNKILWDKEEVRRFLQEKHLQFLLLNETEGRNECFRLLYAEFVKRE